MKISLTVLTFLRRLRSPEIIRTVAGHINDPE